MTYDQFAALATALIVALAVWSRVHWAGENLPAPAPAPEPEDECWVHTNTLSGLQRAAMTVQVRTVDGQLVARICRACDAQLDPRTFRPMSNA